MYLEYTPGLLWMFSIVISKEKEQTAYNNDENLHTFCGIVNSLFMEFPLSGNPSGFELATRQLSIPN